jgi:hypothetical protein
VSNTACRSKVERLINRVLSMAITA